MSKPSKLVMKQTDRHCTYNLPQRTSTVLGIVFLVLLAPVVAYVWKFGLTISSDHSRWGEMGSAMSGIYSPALALLALLVVYGQLKSQTLFNEHEKDQRLIEQNRSDIEYYLEQLDRILLLKDPNGATIREMLHQHFQPMNITDIKESGLLSLGQGLNRQYPQLIALWGAIYMILAGLQTINRYPYTHNASNTLHKIIAMTTFETGVALDNFHHCVTNGRIHAPYQFSPFLRAEA